MNHQADLLLASSLDSTSKCCSILQSTVQSRVQSPGFPLPHVEDTISAENWMINRHFEGSPIVSLTGCHNTCKQLKHQRKLKQPDNHHFLGCGCNGYGVANDGGYGYFSHSDYKLCWMNSTCHEDTFHWTFFFKAEPTKQKESFNIASGTAMCSRQCMLGDLTLSGGKGSSNSLYTRT